MGNSPHPVPIDWIINTIDLRPEDAKKTHKICSVFDFPFYFNTANGNPELPACQPHQDYSFVEVHRVPNKVEHGDNKIDHIYEYSAKTIAQDFIGFIMSPTTKQMEPGGAVWRMYQMRGVFVPEGEVPTEKELEAARLERDNFYARAVDAGDSAYADKGKISDVDDNAKRGAKMLGLDRNWNKTQDRKVETDCPACGKRITKGIVKCPNCHAILDRKRAAEFGFIPPEVANVQTGGGAKR